MSLPLADKIKPKNNGTFALVDAADVEMPDGTRLGDHDIGSLNVVNYDLVSMGVPNLFVDGDPLQIEMDTTEIAEKSATSIISLALNIEYGGLVYTTSPTFLPKCNVATVDLIGFKVFVTVYFNEEKVALYAVSVKNLPESSDDDNGKVLTVVDGAAAWAEPSAGVSSWNDLTDKPFYEEGSTEVLVEETTLDGFVQNSAYGLYFTYTTKPFSLVVGETYTVLWDGEEYVVTAQDASTLNDGAEMIAIGNGTAFGMSGNNEPFIIATDVSILFFFAADPNDTAASHNVGIFQGAVTVKTLDEKYLPMDAIDARIEEYISSALEGDY